MNATIYKDLLGNSFLFSPGDKIWKAKRQACAHAFYKDQLKVMMEVLKGIVESYIDEWSKEIEASSDKSHNIDITQIFERIFARDLITISFGENINDDKFDILMRASKNEADKDKFVETKVSIHEALHEINDQLVANFLPKMIHPVGILCFLMSGKNLLPSILYRDRVTKDNCHRIRAVLLAYVHKRKSGEVKSQVKGTDLLTLFLKSPEIFTDDFIVDELLDFFLAGVLTTNFASRTMLSYFSKNPEGLAKVRSEFAA